MLGVVVSVLATNDLIQTRLSGIMKEIKSQDELPQKNIHEGHRCINSFSYFNEYFNAVWALEL